MEDKIVILDSYGSLVRYRIDKGRDIYQFLPYGDRRYELYYGTVESRISQGFSYTKLKKMIWTRY